VIEIFKTKQKQLCRPNILLLNILWQKKYLGHQTWYKQVTTMHYCQHHPRKAYLVLAVPRLIQT
jgi:hypothetical protein